MNSPSPLLSQLIDALQCMPGIGPKSAQRIALTLLEKRRDRAVKLADLLIKAMDQISHCDLCRTLTEETLCHLCQNPHRDPKVLCIVESPMDVLAIESTGAYQGLYFVLLGKISPLDGIGPQELKLSDLDRRLKSGQVSEVILALNPTVEGEATSHYLTHMIKAAGKQVTRIAYGVPFGGELEFVDSHTLQHAFGMRQQVE